MEIQMTRGVAVGDKSGIAPEQHWKNDAPETGPQQLLALLDKHAQELGDNLLMRHVEEGQ